MTPDDLSPSDIAADPLSSIPQPIPQEPLYALPAGHSAEASRPSPIPYHCTKEYSPNFETMRETPRHRLVLTLLAQGFTNKEAAEQTGYTPQLVSDLRRQKWAQQVMSELQAQAGFKAVQSLLQGAAAKAAQTVIDIATSTDTWVKPADRLKASQDILNRLFGQAPQIIKTGKADPAQLPDEELARIANAN